MMKGDCPCILRQSRAALQEMLLIKAADSRFDDREALAPPDDASIDDCYVQVLVVAFTSRGAMMVLCAVS